jgi:hypothetical protein
MDVYHMKKTMKYALEYDIKTLDKNRDFVDICYVRHRLSFYSVF